MKNIPISEPEMPREYYQKGLGLKAYAKDQLTKNYHSHLINYMRSHDYKLQVGNICFFLAQEFGFCYGVERAVEYAYQAREKFPDRRIFLTGEIIHNPHVNQRMIEMGIGFLTGQYSKGDSYETLQTDDVVILPAFGVTIEELERLSKIGCVVVDTTCGSVLNVWKRVEQYARDGFTSVIHGKYAHEETKATSSQCLKYENGHYLIVRNMDETEMVCRFLAGKWSKEALLSHFNEAVSMEFDPDMHLQKIGIANQTTMLSGESLAIANRLKHAITEKYGEQNTDQHFRTFDTICSATQDRQDAILSLVKKQKLDLMLVIGGYNSSNTNHLVEMSSEYTKAYHIDDASCLNSLDIIECKPIGQKITAKQKNWLPQGEIKVGLTAGASTPNNKIGETIDRVAQLRDFNLNDWMVDGI